MTSGRPKHRLCNSLLIILCISFILCGCGEGPSSDDDDFSSAGSISFHLDWQDSRNQHYVRQQSPSGDVCVDYAIEFVNATIENSSNNVISSGRWRCAEHSGTIGGVPTGSDMILSISATVDDEPLWQSQTTNISVNKDQNTNVGIVEMNYVGDDVTPPAISDHYPATGDSIVFINSGIGILFSENVVSASVNTSSINLFDASTSEQVDFSVVYDADTFTAQIDPNSDLKPNTNYNVVITTEVEDLAGNPMEVAYRWDFTTMNDTVVSAESIDSHFTDSNITIDGDASEWHDVQEYQIQSTKSVKSSGVSRLSPAQNDQDCSAVFKTVWKFENLYVLIQVTDDSIQKDSQHINNDDSVELYFDGGDEDASTYDSNDIQLVVDTENGAYASSDTISFSHAASITGNTYTIEFAVPFSEIPIAPSIGTIIGFDIAVNDDDDGQRRDHQLVWNGNGTGWYDPRQFGQLTLSELIQ